MADKNYATKGLSDLITLFRIAKKKELTKHCHGMHITKQDLFAFIMGAKTGFYDPFTGYEACFFEQVPENLQLKEDERPVFDTDENGILKADGIKWMNRFRQILDQRRLFAGHAFFTECQRGWYILYFDQRDSEPRDNHSTHGAHIHLLSHHSNLDLYDVWTNMQKGQVHSKIHIKFDR